MVTIYLKFGQTCSVYSSGVWVKKERGRVCVWFGAGTLNIIRSCVHQVPLNNSLCLQMLVGRIMCHLHLLYDCLWLRHKIWLKVQFTQIIKKKHFYSLPLLIPTNQIVCTIYAEVWTHPSTHSCYTASSQNG